MHLKKNVVLAIILVLMIAFPGIVTAADIPVKESWAVIEQDQKPVGYSCDQLFKLENGYLYVSDTTLRMKLMEGSASKVTQHMEMYVDQKYLAKSAKLITEINGSKTQMSSQFEDKMVKTITITADGKENQIIHQLDAPVYFTTSFIDYIIAGGPLKTGKVYKGSIWDLSSFSVSDIAITIEKKTTYKYGGLTIPVFSTKIKSSQELTALIDAKGETFWAQESKLNLIARKVEKEEIPELQTLSADALIVPGNIQVARPFRSTGSRIKVTWKDVKFSDFNWDDNRQKLVEHKENPAGQEVTLAISKDERDFTGIVSLPVQDESMALFLQDTLFITPSSPLVKKLVTEIAASETDGWAVTQKLAKWVFEYIKPEMIPETLTTEQILETKHGKCVEYAVLFAALARAAGLPTRMALGERYQDNIWIGHMWNEVWLGEWITIDVSHNQIAPDALLLKFVHSETVVGTQKVRVGLIGQLGISIEDLQVPDDLPEALKDLQTGIQENTYTNIDYRCQITAPEGWKLTETTDQGYPVIVLQSETLPDVTGVLLMFSAPQGVTAEQILNARIPALKNALPEFSLVNQETAPLGNDQAAVGTWTFVEDGIKLRQQNWIVIREDLGFLFVFVAPDGEWVNHEGIFPQMTEQFKIIE